MRRLKIKLNLILISSSILISSCSSVHIKDNEFCGDLGPDGAHCNHTLSTQPRDIPKPEWDKLRFGWICTNSEGFENWKTAIETLCRKNGCTYEEKKNVTKFFKKMFYMQSRIDRSKKNHNFQSSAENIPWELEVN